MSGYNAPQPQSHAISRVIAREEALERKRPTPTTATLAPLRFTALGPAAAGVESTREQIDGVVVIVQVQLSLLANASADHTIEIGVDGSPVEQFTLPSGEAMINLSAHIVAGTYITVKLITDIDSDLLVKLKLQPH